MIFCFDADMPDPLEVLARALLLQAEAQRLALVAETRRHVCRRRIRMVGARAAARAGDQQRNLNLLVGARSTLDLVEQLERAAAAAG